jgi:hypothetical protein
VGADDDIMENPIIAVDDQVRPTFHVDPNQRL